MSRMVGTVSMGIRAPIIRSGDDLVEIVTNSVLETVKDGALTIRDRDVIAMTEAIVARAQGNYASVDDIQIMLVCAPSWAGRPWVSCSPSSAAIALPSVCGASPRGPERSS